MFHLADGFFILGKTKSSEKWHILKTADKSWCNHALVGELMRNVPFEKLMSHGELCTVCYNALTFGAVRGQERRWNLRNFPRSMRPEIRRLRA